MQSRPEDVRTRGFSLMELLAVIAIIAILAGFLYPVAVTMKERGNQTDCIGNLQSIGQALKLYRLDERQYPPALYGWVDLSQPGNPDNPGGLPDATTFLYPAYCRSKREFRCPDNPNRLDETLMSAPFNDKSPLRALPRVKVPRPDGGYTVRPAVKGPLEYFLFDSYDGGMVPPNSHNPNDYELHYRRGWTLVLGGNTTDQNRALINRNPEDDTFVTACTYHRQGMATNTSVPASGSMDMVLFLDGHTEKVPSAQVMRNGWTTLPR